MRKPDRKRVKVLKPGARQRPTIWTRAMHFQVAGGLVAMVTVMLGGGIFRSQLHQRKELDQMMKAWRVNYHLSDEQVARIRKLEEEFHGSGNILTEPVHTLAQTLDHEPSICRVMAPEDAARFLADRKRFAENQKRRIRVHAH